MLYEPYFVENMFSNVNNNILKTFTTPIQPTSKQIQPMVCFVNVKTTKLQQILPTGLEYYKIKQRQHFNSKVVLRTKLALP